MSTCVAGEKVFFDGGDMSETHRQFLALDQIHLGSPERKWYRPY